MTEVVTAPPPAAVPRDRSAGLVFFGLVQLALGALCALIALGVAAAMSTLPRAGNGAPPAAALTPSLVIDAVAACYFVSVGIGSMRKRRWARALSAAVSALWLALGIVAAAVLFVSIPKLLIVVPPSEEQLFVGSMVTFAVMFFVLLPLALLLFYKSEATRTTCERRDARIRWTDRAPLPVLALAILLAFASISLLVSLSNRVLPVLGSILTGGAAAITMLVLSGLCAFLAVQLYRLKESAWWTLVLLQVIGGVLAVVTALRIDVNAVYARAGMLTPQIEAMKLQELYRNPLLIAAMAAAWIAYFAFLLSIRKYFVGTGPRTRAGEWRPGAAA
jgi:hypothetical protein